MAGFAENTSGADIVRVLGLPVMLSAAGAVSADHTFQASGFARTEGVDSRGPSKREGFVKSYVDPHDRRRADARLGLPALKKRTPGKRRRRWSRGKAAGRGAPPRAGTPLYGISTFRDT